MKYSLRNQDKILKAFGQNYLDLLLTSLFMHFIKPYPIEEQIAEPYNIIQVPNVLNESSIFELYVISKESGVLTLAYKSEII